MSGTGEAYPGPMAGPNLAALAEISSDQIITFNLYRRVVLPLDGYVFWVRAGTASQPPTLNDAPLNQGLSFTPSPGLTVPGSLHYASDQRQEETSSQTFNRVVFTTKQEVRDLNDIDPASLYIADYDGLRFTFAQRGSYYAQAGLHHYAGVALLPTMETQLIDNPLAFDTESAIVSNSLPAWLALEQPFPVFPSFAVPLNMEPPYAVVHIEPSATAALQAFPAIDQTGSSWQLAVDRVRVTLYGVRNAPAIDFLNSVLQYSLNTDAIGLMNMPIVRDDKQPQTEFGTLAQRKAIDFTVSYYQTRMQNVARQMIVAVGLTMTIGDA